MISIRNDRGTEGTSERMCVCGDRQWSKIKWRLWNRKSILIIIVLISLRAEPLRFNGFFGGLNKLSREVYTAQQKIDFD
jgi:hypothetical protein